MIDGGQFMSQLVTMSVISSCIRNALIRKTVYPANMETTKGSNGDTGDKLKGQGSGKPKIVSKVSSSNMSKVSSSNMSKVSSSNMSKVVPSCVPKSASNNVSNGVPNGVSKSILNSTSNGVSNSVSNGQSNYVSKELSNCICNGLSNCVCNEPCNSVSNGVSNGMSNCSSNGALPNGVIVNPSRLAANILSILPKNVSYGASTNATVGHMNRPSGAPSNVSHGLSSNMPVDIPMHIISRASSRRIMKTKMCSSCLKVHHIPTITSLWFVATFVTSYILAVTNGHVYPIFPFISDTGTLPPESCLFGFMLNLGTLLMGITMYIRHRQIQFVIIADGSHLNPKWHTASFVFGSIGCLGLCIVANFQETNALVVHLIGASMAFGIGMLYFIVQAKISFDLRHVDKSLKHVSNYVIYLRIFLSLSEIPLFFIACFCSMEAGDRFVENVQTWNIEWWTLKKDGYEYRMAGNFAEWIMALFMVVFVLSFTTEFKALQFDGVAFKFSKKNVQEA